MSDPTNAPAPADPDAAASAPLERTAAARDGAGVECPSPVEPPPATDRVPLAAANVISLPAMPEPATPPPIEPSLLAPACDRTAPESVPSEQIARGWWVAVAATGLVLFLLSLKVSGFHTGAKDAAYAFGTLVGAIALWPAIVLGLFSLSPRFRTPRRRIVILLSVWAFCIMGQLGNIVSHDRVARSAKLRRAPGSLATTENAAADEPTEPSPTATPARRVEPVTLDFSHGSDARLIKLVDSAVDLRFRDIVAGYQRECDARPDDALLALERVRFIERFAFAEDLTIPGADRDLRAAVRYLTTRFADAPGAVLYQLRQFSGADFEGRARKHEKQAQYWQPDYRAEYFLLRAQHATDENLRWQHARESFALQPSTAAGLILLDAAHAPERRGEGLRIARHAVFQSAQPWPKRRAMDFLFDAGQSAPAMLLFQDLQAHAPGMVQNPETAMRLAAAGHIGTARATLRAIASTRWNAESLPRARFEFEMKYGTATEAAAAYRALRATHALADPLLRDRFTLLLKHPAAGCSATDLVGVLTILCTLALLLAAPALVVVPVHYWSLLRTRRGKPPGWPAPRWGLREAWVALGALCCVELAGIWIFQPAVMRTWWTQPPNRVATAPLTDASILGQQWLMWLVVAALLGAAVWRARAWRTLGMGGWSPGQTIGMCLAATVLLRIVLLGYIAIWSDVVDGEFATFSPTTRQLSLALLKAGGPLGLIATVALMVPLLEELLFRGVLLQAFAKHIPFGAANLLQSLLFAAVHENLRLLPFFAIFGLVCGFFARRAGGLLPSIGVHVCNNLLVCLVLIVKH